MYDALAAYYDRLDDDVDREAWADWIAELVKQYACGIHGADLGCGTGTLTQKLAKRLCVEWACDASCEMLNRAAERLRIPLVSARFETVHAPAKSDFLNIANDGINYLKPDMRKAAFTHLYRMLHCGGALLFDISTPYKLRNVIGNQVFFSEEDDLSMFWRNQLEEDCVRMSLTFFERQPSGLYRRTEEEQIQYIQEPDAVEKDLRAAGFERIYCFSMFSQTPPQAEAQRIQFVAVREGRR